MNRTGVKSDPSKCMKATEDFLAVVLYGHIVAAAKEIITELEGSSYTCQDIAKLIMKRHITFNLCSSDGNMYPKGSSYGYAVDLLSLGMLWHSFHDAIKEGDGDRIIIHWKFLLIVFKASGRQNYANKAFNFLVQIVLLFPRKVAKLKRNRTINTVAIITSLMIYTWNT